jgi:CRP/FNR family transcriptional regulator, cyclic AMP receptor protein
MTLPSSKHSSADSPGKLALLRNHPLFGSLPPAAIEHLGSYMKRRTLPRGSTIFAKGDPGTSMMGVLTGSVKISVPSADGRDIVLNIIHEDEIFGEIALLDGHPRTADATAMTDCELMVIERRDFIAYLRSQPDLTMQIIEILCSRLRQTSEQVQDVTFLDLPKRLAKALLRLIADTEGQASIRKVTITQREISQIIGRSRESTNKQLRIWAAQGWIRLERGAVTVLRREKIAEAAAEGPSSICREPVMPPRSNDPYSLASARNSGEYHANQTDLPGCSIGPTGDGTVGIIGKRSRPGTSEIQDPRT